MLVVGRVIIGNVQRLEQASRLTDKADLIPVGEIQVTGIQTDSQPVTAHKINHMFDLLCGIHHRCSVLCQEVFQTNGEIRILNMVAQTAQYHSVPLCLFFRCGIGSKGSVIAVKHTALDPCCAEEIQPCFHDGNDLLLVGIAKRYTQPQVPLQGINTVFPGKAPVFGTDLFCIAPLQKFRTVLIRKFGILPAVFCDFQNRIFRGQIDVIRRPD